MDHTRHTRLAADALTETALKGAAILGPDDERIGHVAVRELDFMRDVGNSVHAVTRWPGTS